MATKKQIDSAAIKKLLKQISTSQRIVKTEIEKLREIYEKLEDTIEDYDYGMDKIDEGLQSFHQGLIRKI